MTCESRAVQGHIQDGHSKSHYSKGFGYDEGWNFTFCHFFHLLALSSLWHPCVTVCV